MSLRLTNTLTGQKEELRSIHPPQVTLYVCGMTVYDECHVGHARGAVVFDMLRRYLEFQGFEVKHVRNITDVDDKIIERARAEIERGQTLEGLTLKKACQAVAQRYEASFRKDFASLGLLAPHEEPRATEYIPKMVGFIQTLVDRGVAYSAADGVYCSVRKISPYGELSHQKLDQMLEGVRVEPGAGKKESLDFALWKKAKPEEPNWDSPWGAGRPGWHIECSTMATDLLGDRFDIHGGGQDLVFPHHENERAQALAAGKPFAMLWVHNGLLTVDGQKMSKSVGNIIQISEVLEKHPPDVLRFFFLNAHYRSPIDFTWKHLEEAASAYERWTTFISHTEALGPGESESHFAVTDIEEDFRMFMENDLNTPQALASLFALVRVGTGSLTEIQHIRYAKDRLIELAKILGFFQDHLTVDDEINQLIAQRDEARQRKDYKTSDALRQKITSLGYVVEDTSGRTVVRKRV